MNHSVVKTLQSRNRAVCRVNERFVDRNVDFPRSGRLVKPSYATYATLPWLYGTPKNVRMQPRAVARRAPFSLYSLIGREEENKEKQQRKRNFSLSSSSSSSSPSSEGRARESKDFWFVLFSLGESVFWPTRGYIHSSLSSPVSRSLNGRPPAAERWADAEAATAAAAAADATDALQSHPSILVPIF